MQVCSPTFSLCLNTQKYLPLVQCLLSFLVEEREKQTVKFDLLAGNKLLSLSPLRESSAAHVSTSSTAVSRLRSIKNDYRVLGVAVREFGAQVIFYSVLPKRKGLKRQVKSVMVTDLKPQLGFLCLDHATLKNVVYWELIGSICQRRRGTSLVIGLPRWWRRL